MNALEKILTNLEATPDCGCYAPGQKVSVKLTAASRQEAAVALEVKFFCGLDLVESQHREVRLQPGENELNFDFQPGQDPPAGYGVDVTLSSQFAQGTLTCQTAFDVLHRWTEFPRYGFLCDFSPERQNIESTLNNLNRFHLNGLQFYDWQYRHDSLVPPQDEFTDPLGRSLSLKVTKDLIAAAHQHCINTMPYLAIYAASAAFWRAHPEMALYDDKHQLIPFGDDFLGIMNPEASRPWSEHLLKECTHVLSTLPFDGLHIDQYGEPKTGWNANGEPVDLPKAFADFIEAAAKLNPGKPILFNAVGNWPIDTLAGTRTAFNYIEIWPPQTTYQNVAETVRNARELSGKKPVVIALYLPANRSINNRLADAVILSAGGTRIEIGENGRLLSDPYFPKHEAMSDDLSECLRRQIELVIRYEDWISPLVPETDLPEIKVPDGVMYFFRKTMRGASLSLVNLGPGAPLHWNEAHSQPVPLHNFILEIMPEEQIQRVWLVSPDASDLSPQKLNFITAHGKILITIPSLEIWDVLLFEKLGHEN